MVNHQALQRRIHKASLQPIIYLFETGTSLREKKKFFNLFIFAEQSNNMTNSKQQRCEFFFHLFDVQIWPNYHGHAFGISFFSQLQKKLSFIMKLTVKEDRNVESTADLNLAGSLIVELMDHDIVNR